MRLISSTCTPQALVRFVLIGLVLVLIGANTLPALAQEIPYTDPAGHFTATIPDGWTDESPAEYGLFTNAGVSLYLLTVEGDDLQASIDTAVKLLAPELSDGNQISMGEFPSPSGIWKQEFFTLSSGQVGNAVAQSNGRITVVILITADSMGAMQAILTDSNAMLATVRIEGVSAATPESDTEASPTAAAPVSQAEGEISFPDLTGPYAVGRTIYSWTDDSREETYTSEHGEARMVTVWVWYPAESVADEQPATYLTDGMSGLFQPLYGIPSSSVHSHAY